MLPKAPRVPVPRAPRPPRPERLRPPRSTHVSHAGLNHGPVHAAGRQAGGGSGYGVSIRGLLFLLFLHGKVVRGPEMKVRAPKGKTAAEPAPTKRDAVPWGATRAGRGPKGSAHALHHGGQRLDAAPAPSRGTAERTDPASFGHRMTVTQELRLGWGEADFTGATRTHSSSRGAEARPQPSLLLEGPHRAAAKEPRWWKPNRERCQRCPHS